ncbi:uncharacterized protein KY384_006171 [Bacidia gigantensis]|uniref:uncharacterized protein n=1 Tax=Bacidia gigantensis TaxID=2732470 RepID=UPI001D03900E|nr:uncharacterized protein KY384_006171 [Bacidia gigantensis]KAG8529534.1 hypothetical protein KY384_006171 [Bacidia gigantensis]
MAHDSKNYVLDHQEESVSSHRRRTAANSLGYLLSSIKPDMQILDVGCGPGSLTVDLAALVPKGKATGIEISDDIIKQANALAQERKLDNVVFEKGDIKSLKYSDNTFDVVHGHQVLQHLADPVSALREMRRVTKPGGMVALREGEISGQIFFPAIAGIAETSDLTFKVMQSQGANPGGGRQLLSYALKAGFDMSAVAVSSSTYCFATPEDRNWWADMWAYRLLRSSLGTSALEKGFASQSELEEYAEGWRKWASEDEGMWSNINVEIICQVA